MSVAELFRSARDRKGMTQAAAAAAAGLSWSTVARLEGGRLQPLAPTLFALADVLDVPYDQVRDAVLESTRTTLPAPGEQMEHAGRDT